MCRSILKMLPLPLLVVLAYPVQRSVAEPSSQTIFGYSSEDFGGGSSYLGVDTRDITADRLVPLKLKEERGVEITMVDQDAPAGKAGLKEHDVILSVNGNEVESVEQLRRMIREIPPGRIINLGISREGQPLTIKAQLADRKDAFASAGHGKAFNFTMPAMPAMPMMPDIDIPVSVVVVHSPVRSGLMIENLTPQLADFFGTKNGQGVLVRSVDKGSRAEKAGFRAGDVIVRVNGQAINDTGDFTRALHDRKENTVTVNVVRDKKEQTLTLTLPERRQSGFLDENFAMPDVNPDLGIDLRKLQSQLASLRPELEQQVRQQAAEIERLKPEIERETRELREHQEEFRRKIREMERQWRDQEHKLQQELRRQFREVWTEI